MVHRQSQYMCLKADKTATVSTPGQSAPKVVGGLKEIRVSNAEVNRPLNMPPPPPCECEGAAGVDGGALGRGDSSKSCIRLRSHGFL
jgi:hypothetical protein